MSSEKRERIRIRATFFSLGGMIFAGLVILFASLAYDAFLDPIPNRLVQALLAFFLLIVLLYGLDAWSESLSLQGTELSFNSLLKRKRLLDVCRYPEIFVIHEGLNQEKGVVSLLFRGLDEEERFSLGPFWRQHELEDFFTEAESATGVCKLVSITR